MPDIGFVNGRFMPLDEATVSVEDRGFQFGDGIYEVIRTYHGQLFQLDAHLARLERSAKAIELPLPWNSQQWATHVREGITRSGYAESKVYLQLTRGAAPRDHVFPVSMKPTAVMTVREMKPMDPTLQASGVAVMTMDDWRWGRCDIKSVNLLPNVMARQKAKQAGAFEAVFVHRGQVTEGAVSNVMVVKAGRVLTAPESERILSGVTRTIVLELARKEGLPVEERFVTLDDFLRADEIFLTGTTVEVLPVIRVDGKSVGTGKPGPVTLKVQAAFQRFIG
ncbi:MAG: D-amino-acid transaminase [Nitrospiraceae bacterium]